VEAQPTQASEDRPPEHPEVAAPDAPSEFDADHSAPFGPVTDADIDDYAHLFGATQFRPVSAAGVPVRSEDLESPEGGEPECAAADDALIAQIPAPEPDASDAPPSAGDHDGITISLAQLRQMQAAEAVSDAPMAVEASSPVAHLPSVTPTMVHAVACSLGHYNPPSATVCRVCAVEIPGQSHVTIPRPVLGRFRFSDGTELPVARPMLLGRSPQADGPVSGELPELVQLVSPNKELSGTHLEIRLEGWQVLVVDRRSTNGSTVRLPMREPFRLHPGEPFPIVPGSVVDMAGEVSFTFEVAS
jgi:hypothetical protein